MFFKSPIRESTSVCISCSNNTETILSFYNWFRQKMLAVLFLNYLFCHYKRQKGFVLKSHKSYRDKLSIAFWKQNIC